MNGYSCFSEMMIHVFLSSNEVISASVLELLKAAGDLWSKSNKKQRLTGETAACSDHFDSKKKILELPLINHTKKSGCPKEQNAVGDVTWMTENL